MDHRKREARAEWIHRVRLDPDDPRRQWGNSGRVVSGDPSQLPPIGEPEVIDTSTPTSEYDQKGRDAWASITDVIQLWRCHRQKDDAAYAHECLRLRDGTFSEADWRSWLKSDLARGEFTDDQRAKFEQGNSLNLTGTNAKCGEINGRRAISRICLGPANSQTTREGSINSKQSRALSLPRCGQIISVASEARRIL